MDTTPRSRVSPFRFQSFIGEPDPEEEMLRARDEARAAMQKAEEPPAPVATFSQEQLDTAEKMGYDKGLQAGYERAKAEFKAQQEIEHQELQQLIEKISAHVDVSVEHQYQFLDRLQSLVPPLALSMAKKVAGSALQDNPLLEIEAVVAHCIAELATDKTLTVFVNPVVTPYLEGILAEKYFHATGKSLALHVSSDANLAMHDCRVEWPSGAVERNTEQLWAEIEKLLQNFQVLFQPHPTQHS